MSVFRTSRGRVVRHCHIPDPFPCKLRSVTEEDIEKARRWMNINFPDAVEALPATFEYNCFGYALTNRHGWFEKAQPFFEDDFFRVSMSRPKVGDVLVYFNHDLEIVAHTAVVTKVEDNEITELRSKWGAMPEVFHTVTDVPEVYGEPITLLRRLSDNAPFTELTNLEEPKDKTMQREEIIKNAIENFSNPDIHFKLLLASRQEIRRAIIDSLPGVKELIELGPEAEKAVLDFFEKDSTQDDDQLSGIALYLLARVPFKEAARPIATYIRSGKLAGINNDLAAHAFLAATEIETINEDPILVAMREAEKFQ